MYLKLGVLPWGDPREVIPPYIILLNPKGVTLINLDPQGGYTPLITHADRNGVASEGRGALH